jgi:hypothetical protein
MRNVDEITSIFLQQYDIRILRPGVILQVSTVIELGRVHKDATDHGHSIPFGPLDQGHMSIMKGSHCRHESDGFSLIPKVKELFFQFIQGIDDTRFFRGH